ncbi:MAG: sigma-70 family RNA polymerase sigma factor [Candidatus Obscuribacter sp.]|nr:sigma-70 family RNA polymerase sigma factor [Candidatus Obscuribacter sp.]
MARKNHTRSEVLFRAEASRAGISPGPGCNSDSFADRPTDLTVGVDSSCELTACESAPEEAVAASGSMADGGFVVSSPLYKADGEQAIGLSVLGGDASAIVREHMTLVRQIARKYSQYAPDSFEDLVQVGSIGLLKAIKYYDPGRARSASFRTLATCYIRGEIRHYLRDHCSIVQVPRRLTEMNSQLSQLEEKLTRALDRTPTVQELAAASGFSVQDVLEAQQSWEVRVHYESLDGNSEEDEREDRRALSEVVPDRRYQELFAASEDRELISQALKRLGERTRQIVEFVFFYDLSQKETAYVLGLSEMGVSRAVHSALKKLREIMAQDGRP